jgi:hypothetical protein
MSSFKTGEDMFVEAFVWYRLGGAESVLWEQWPVSNTLFVLTVVQIIQILETTATDP